MILAVKLGMIFKYKVAILNRFHLYDNLETCHQIGSFSVQIACSLLWFWNLLANFQSIKCHEISIGITSYFTVIIYIYAEYQILLRSWTSRSVLYNSLKMVLVPVVHLTEAFNSLIAHLETIAKFQSLILHNKNLQLSKSACSNKYWLTLQSF